MKKAAVPTTAASGTAVSRSRITAVQSVYIPGCEEKSLPSSQQSRPPWMFRPRPCAPMPFPLAPLSALALQASPARLRTGRGPGDAAWWLPLRGPTLLRAVLLGCLWFGSAPWGAARAGVQFENCVRGLDGSLTCDTVPTGDTYLTDKARQFGLFQNASPGWNEFNPFEGYDEDFGDDPY